MNFFVQLAIMLFAGMVIQSLAPRPPSPKPAALSDWDFPQYDEGTPQTFIFGDVWLDGWMVLGFGNYRVSPIIVRGGKK